MGKQLFHVTGYDQDHDQIIIEGVGAVPQMNVISGITKDEDGDPVLERSGIIPSGEVVQIGQDFVVADFYKENRGKIDGLLNIDTPEAAQAAYRDGYEDGRSMALFAASPDSPMYTNIRHYKGKLRDAYLKGRDEGDREVRDSEPF